MLKELFMVQSGLVSPVQFKLNEITKRSYFLQLSTNRGVENVHTGGVTSLDIDKSENRYLISGCSDGSIYIHDLYNFSGLPHFTAKCVCKVDKRNSFAHIYSVECTSWFGDDNELFITSSKDQSLKVWDANNMKPVENYNCKGRIFHHDCTSFHPILAVASSAKHIELIDLRTGNSIHELRGHNGSVLSCAWSPVNEYMLATGGIDNKILFWDIRSCTGFFKSLDQYNGRTNAGTAHSGYVNGLKFTQDGLLLLSLGTDNRLRLWETLNGHNQMINYGKIKNTAKCNVKFAISDSKPSLAYIPSERYIQVVEILTGKTVRILHGHFNRVNCSYYNQLNQELYTGGKDNNIFIWTPNASELKDYLPFKSKSLLQLPIIRTLDNWSSDEDQ